MIATKYVADWLARADEDILVASILLREGGPANAVCFHCQQTAEKLLKGFLAHHEQHVRKTHDIKLLLSKCESIDEDFSRLAEDITYLSQFYIETRYPGDIPDFSLKEARRALEAAEYIKNFIQETIT